VRRAAGGGGGGGEWINPPVRDARMIVCLELQRFYGDEFGIPGGGRAPSIKRDLNQHAILMARTLL